MTAARTGRVGRVLRRRVRALALVAVVGVLAGWLLDGGHRDPAWPVRTARLVDPSYNEVLVAWAVLGTAASVGYAVWAALANRWSATTTFPKLVLAAVAMVTAVVVARSYDYLVACASADCFGAYPGPLVLLARLAALLVAGVAAWLAMHQAATCRRHS